MAYGPGGLGKDGNRGIHAPTVMGDDLAAEGAISINSLEVPKGKLLGQPSMTPMSRQAVPNATVTGVRDVAAKMSGENELLGQGTTDEGLHDDEYPNLAAGNLPGDPPATPIGEQGNPVDWASVGPYEYPDFAEQPSPKSGAGAAAIPLT